MSKASKLESLYMISHNCCPGASAHPRSDSNTPGAESAMSERAAAIEAAALEVAEQLAEKQQELNRRRREAAVAAKAALVEQMKASIAEIDTEIVVGLCRFPCCSISCRQTPRANQYTLLCTHTSLFLLRLCMTLCFLAMVCVFHNRNHWVNSCQIHKL